MCERDQTTVIQPGPHFMGKLSSEENKQWARGDCILGSYQFPTLCRAVWAPKTSFSKFLINFLWGKYNLFIFVYYF